MQKLLQLQFYICICQKLKYLKSFPDTSVISCDEITSVMDIVSTKMTNAIAAPLIINSDGKKVRYKIDYYFLHTVLTVTILLLIITITCYHYVKHMSKQKNIGALTIIKWKVMNFKKLLLKIVPVIISMT